MTNPTPSPKIKSWHVDRFAIVYVRQSTPQQGTEHQESTARQYALVGRAVDLNRTTHKRKWLRLLLMISGILHGEALAVGYPSQD